MRAGKLQPLGAFFQEEQRGSGDVTVLSEASSAVTSSQVWLPDPTIRQCLQQSRAWEIPWTEEPGGVLSPRSRKGRTRLSRHHHHQSGARVLFARALT